MLFNFQKSHITADDVTVTFQYTVIYIVYKLSLNYRSFKAIAGCPPNSFSMRTARQNTARNAAQCTELVAGQLSRYHHKRPMASKFAEYKSIGVWGAMLEAYSKL